METERVITCSQLQTEPRIPVGSAEECTGGVVSGREWMGYLRVPVIVYFQVPRCRSLLGTARRGGWMGGRRGQCHLLHTPLSLTPSDSLYLTKRTHTPLMRSSYVILTASSRPFSFS
jgi:hypothetical protein